MRTKQAVRKHKQEKQTSNLNPGLLVETEPLFSSTAAGHRMSLFRVWWGGDGTRRTWVCWVPGGLCWVPGGLCLLPAPWDASVAGAQVPPRGPLSRQLLCLGGWPCGSLHPMPGGSRVPGCPCPLLLHVSVKSACQVSQNTLSAWI